MVNFIEITDGHKTVDVNLEQVTYIGYEGNMTNVYFGDNRYLMLQLTKDEFKGQLRKYKLDIIQED